MDAVASREFDTVMMETYGSRGRTGSAWPIVALVGVVIAYAVVLILNFGPAITEPDDNGYFAQGSLLFTTGHTYYKPASDAQYIGMHWLLTPDGNYISRYPPGLAVLIGLIYATLGFKAAVFVNPALSIAMVIGSFFLSRRMGLSRWWSVGVVALLASNPTVINHALSGDSHTAVACVIVWGLHLLLKWSQDRRPISLFYAGLVLGLIPTIRYPDVVMAAGMTLFVLWHFRSHRPLWKHILFGTAGAAIPIVPLLVRNQLLLGGFWKTGYALTNEQTGFGWNYFTQYAFQYIQNIHSGGVGLFFALGVVGFVYLISMKSTRAVGVMFTLIALPMLLLYMAYYWAPNMPGATMRFLLPTFPMYVLAGVWVLAELTKTAPRGARVAVPLVAIAAQALWAFPSATQYTQRLASSKKPLAMLTDAIDRNVPRESVVIANGLLLQHLDFVRHWKVADASLAGGVRGGGPGGGGGGGGGGPPMGGQMGGPPMGGPGGGGNMGPPMGGPGAGPGGFGGGFGGGGADQPSPMQSEKRDLQRQLYPGTTRAKQEKFAADVMQWADGKDVYLVGLEADVKQMLGRAIEESELQIVDRIKVPSPRMGGPMGGFGGPMGNTGRQRGGSARPSRDEGPVMTEYVIAIWTPAS